MSRIHISPTQNPNALSCDHKISSECSTGSAVCCNCLFSDPSSLMSFNLGLGLPPLWRGDVKSRYCTSCGEYWNGRATTKTYPMQYHGPESESESQSTSISLPDLDDVHISYSARRRKNKRQYKQQRKQQHWQDALEFDPQPAVEQLTLSTATPTPEEPQGGESSQTVPALSSALINAIEQIWCLEQSIGAAQNPNPDIYNWGGNTPPFSITSTPLNLGQTAEHASLLLDVFSRVKPVDDRQLTVVQKRLVTTALTSVLSITRQLRLLAVSANEPLEPLPLGDDITLRIDAGCVVCYERVADMVLMPCRHLTLCEICCDEIEMREKEGGAGVEAMRCPVCRGNVLDRIKIFRN